jgi:hypothetical protein
VNLNNQLFNEDLKKELNRKSNNNSRISDTDKISPEKSFKKGKSIFETESLAGRDFLDDDSTKLRKHSYNEAISYENRRPPQLNVGNVLHY